jgi:aspartate/methionine/tyrosine aminotransferase
MTDSSLSESGLRFAKRTEIPANPIVVIEDRVHEMLTRGENVIVFHVGDVGWDTPQFIKDAACESLNQGYTHYGPSLGYPEFKAVLAEKLAERNGVHVDPSAEILVTQSATYGIYISILALLDPGDEMLLLDPCYPSYEICVKMAGGIPVFIPTREEDEWKASSSEIESRVTPRTKGIMINFPNNPTGEVLSKEELESIARIAKKHNLFVISDEAYEAEIFDGLKHHSIASLPDMKERTATIFSFSKTYAMTGWRLGYIVGPNAFIKRANVIHETVLAHVTSHCQMAGLAALRGSQAFTSRMVRELDARRLFLVGGLNRIRGVSCKMPKGAFYCFPSIKKSGMSSQQFSEHLLLKGNVCVIPGSAFGKCGEGYVRFAYSQSNMQEISTGLERMATVFGKK